VVLCLLAAADPDADALTAAHRVARRLSVGQAIVGTAPEGVALIASLGDPVLRTLPAEEVGTWARAIAGPGFLVGQSAASDPRAFDEAARQAAISLRMARGRGRDGSASWSRLGVDRLLAQLPAAAARDLPESLARFLRAEPRLVETLAAYVDAAGEVKATAAALSLHRSGVYYRLQRIEEMTGLDLDRGEDRLLAHLAIRLDREGR
jgi:hypothetical protein